MATQIPEPFQEQVKLDVTVGQAPYGSAFDNAALHETLLGQLGSTIAQTAANSLATKMGYDEGMNPHGDILPPITEADKHYAQSYLAQSKNVLSNQINQMMSEAQTEISKAYRITPDMITQYQEQIGRGTAEILQNAPTGVKQELGAQYGNSIVSTTGALERRMIGQNKDEAISSMKVADKNTDTSILDNAAMGNGDLARKLYEQKVEQNKKQRAAGMMTSLEEQTSNTSARLSYYSGLSNSKAISARNQKGDALAKYLTSLSDPKNKPADLSFSEWNTIGNNTLSLMRHMDSLQQTDKNLILSDLTEKMAIGQLTEQDILSAYQSPAVNREDINELLTKLYTRQSRGITKAEKVANLTENFASAQAHGESSEQTVNDAYNGLVRAAKQKNPNSAPMDAESSIAAISGGPVPAFLRTVANLAKSNNLDDVIAASNAYHRVQGIAPQNVMGINEDAYNFINAFDTFRQVNPGDPATALAQTRNALATRTPDEQKAIQSNWNAIYRKKYGTPELRSNFARSMLRINSFFNSTNIQNKAVADDHITNLLEKYTMLLGGDVETAKQLTQKAVDNVYGDTWVNGRHEKGYLSLEKISGLEQEGTWFIQQDIVKQMNGAFKTYKDAYDSGNSDYYYRIKNPEIYEMNALHKTVLNKSANDSELAFIKQRLGEISKQPYFESMKFDQEVNSLQQRQSQLIELNRAIAKGHKTMAMQTKPIQIEKVWRGRQKGAEGRVDVLNLSVIPETNTTLSYDNAQPISGNYFVKLISPNGGLENLDSITGYKMSPVYYSPDIGEIRKNYAAFHNKFGNQPSFHQQLDEYLRTKGVSK